MKPAMHNLRLTLLVPAFCVLIAPSCKKKGTPSASSCKIIGVRDNIGSNTSTISLTYDNEGRVATEQITSGGSPTQKVFTYNGNTELITTTNGSNTSTDSIVLNSDGLAEADYYSTGSTQTQTTYTYSGNEAQTGVIQPVSGGVPAAAATYMYTWANGNLTVSDNTTSATAEVFTYDTTAPSQPGDYWQMLQLTSYGYTFVRNTNLITGITSISNGTTYPFEKFTYTFDNSHKITQVISTYGATTETISYEYSCSN